MLLLAEWNFGILLTWTSEEGLPLFKVEMVEYFPLFFCCCFCFEEVNVCRNGKVFCVRVFSVKKVAGRVQVMIMALPQTAAYFLQENILAHSSIRSANRIPFWKACRKILLGIYLKQTRPRALVQNQHTRELISCRTTSHKHNNKDLSRLR